jgi:uncharacterized membrane protein
MTWRSSTTPQDRIFACLPYLLPLVEVIAFAGPFLVQFPAAQVLFLPLLPIMSIYGSIPFAGLIVFFALYLLVIRNDRINHFIRFNAMQAILLDIILVLCSIIFSVLAPALGGGGLLMDTLYSVVFLGTIAAVGYSVVQSGLGRYAEIPTLSDAVYMQVR